MENTEGFYKYDNPDLLYSPNIVTNSFYELQKEKRETYTYPVDGWYWFDSDDDAYTFFNIEKPKIDENFNYPLF